jgi:NAD(P)-dependent dehydrogenase (short-subunit alcohol dehydrogenase family)
VGRLAGKVALITGGARGMGKSHARHFVAEGARVVIGDLLDEHGHAVAAKLGAQACRYVHQDVTSETDWARAVATAVDDFGGLDVLVNNAGGAPTHPFLEWPLDDFRQALDLNLTGAFACAQRAARLMVDAGTPGRIVNVTSVHEHIPLPGAAGYCAAKGGLGLLTKVMALELGEHGITVNAVAPGEIATAMTGNENVDPASVERPALPAKRPGHAEEIAAAVAFLASPEARYVNGASIVVDGGLMLTAAQFNAEVKPG